MHLGEISSIVLRVFVNFDKFTCTSFRINYNLLSLRSSIYTYLNKSLDITDIDICILSMQRVSKRHITIFSSPVAFKKRGKEYYNKLLRSGIIIIKIKSNNSLFLDKVFHNNNLLYKNINNTLRFQQIVCIKILCNYTSKLLINF